MAITWTDPTAHVFAVGEVVSAASMNSYIQQNLALLGQSKGATVATSQTTTSVTYTDLATVGPAVTLTTMTTCLVIVSCHGSNNTITDAFDMSFAVSGATTIAAATTGRAVFQEATAGLLDGASFASYLTGLTAGSNTFTSKYEVNAGTGTFLDRNIIVIPLTA